MAVGTDTNIVSPQQQIPCSPVSSPPKSFTEHVQRLQAHLGDNRGLLDVDINVLLNELAQYVSNPQEWEKFAFFDKSRYTRNLVDDGNGKYNLLIVAWGPGQKSPIHDHANSHCLMKVLDGELIETQYEWPSSATLPSDHGDGMNVRNESSLKCNEVTYIHDKIGLHRVANASSTKPAVSLHLYTPPIELCHTFCEKTGKQRAACCAVFHSRKGKTECPLLRKYREVIQKCCRS